MNVDTELCHCSNWKSTIRYLSDSILCLIRTFSWTSLHAHFVRLTLATDHPPMTWVSDRWSDDHVGTVVIRCRLRAGRMPDLSCWLAVYSKLLPFQRDRSRHRASC